MAQRNGTVITVEIAFSQRKLPLDGKYLLRAAESDYGSHDKEQEPAPASKDATTPAAYRNAVLSLPGSFFEQIH
jgi:hypothetical protein